MKGLKPSSTKILQKASQNRVRIFKNISWSTVSHRWGTGTPFLFPKAQIPSCADPHRIIHITSLPPRGGGTICDCSSQPKLPYLEFWDSLHGWRRDSPPFHQRGDILPMECLLKDTSKVPLLLPSSVMLYTNPWDCSQPLPPFATNTFLGKLLPITQQRLPCLVEDAESSLNTNPAAQWHF